MKLIDIQCKCCPTIVQIPGKVFATFNEKTKQMEVNILCQQCNSDLELIKEVMEDTANMKVFRATFNAIRNLQDEEN